MRHVRHRRLGRVDSAPMPGCFPCSYGDSFLENVQHQGAFRAGSLFKLVSRIRHRRNEHIVLESDFPRDVPNCVTIFVGQLIEDDTDVQIRFPGAVAPRPRAKGSDTGFREALAYACCESFKNVAVPIRHHEVFLCTLARRIGNSKGILVPAPQERNPRKRPWGSPASPAGGHVVGIGTSWHAPLVGEFLLRQVGADMRRKPGTCLSSMRIRLT